MLAILFWRRGRDSNPRYGFPYTAFRERRLQPLGHLSIPLYILSHRGWFFTPICAKITSVAQSEDCEQHFAPVAQLDRALACGAKGRRFESCQVYQVKSPSLEGLFT